MLSQAGRLGLLQPDLPDLQLLTSGDATFRNNKTLRDFSKKESSAPITCWDCGMNGRDIYFSLQW